MNELKKGATVVDNKSKKERAATLVEYVLLVALIAIAAIAVMKLFGQAVSNKFSYLGSVVEQS